MKLIPVCSGKGGAGKSCVCAYTAEAMAGLKRKTLLIDAGGAPGSLDIILGMQDSSIYNLGDVLCGDCEPRQAIIPVNGRDNLFLLPAGIPPFGKAAQMGFADLINHIKNDYDFIFVDNPDFSLLGPGGASAVLLVITPDTLSVRSAAQKCRELYEAGAKDVRLVINNVPARVIPMKSFKNFDDVIDIIGARLIAVIPASQKLLYSSNNGLPLSRESLAPQVFNRLAERLLGRPRPLLIR